MYSPSARITWNGNPIAVTDLPVFTTSMPQSRHDVQAFDCHPLPGSTVPPALALSVTGQVTHGTEPPPHNTGNVHPRDFDFLPRVFSQSMILVCDATPKPDGSPRYLISADSFRFC
ncbi:hypothetical protein ACM66B_001281 [Microbotryomycetes sp. NB124-2]